MVFEIWPIKSPGVNMLARERPCLEHVRQLSIWADQPLGHVLSMVSIRGRVGSWGFGAVDLKDHAYQVCCFILIGEEPGLKPIMAG